MASEPFVYLWVEHSTGLMYLGSRTKKNCHVNDGYICSSKYVKPLIESNPNGWTRSILFSGSRDEVLFVEKAILQILDARNNPLFYNRSNSDGMLKGVSGQKQDALHIQKRVVSFKANQSKKKTRFHLGKFGSKHPTSKKICVDGVIYGSSLEAQRVTGISYKTLSHWASGTRDFALRQKKYRHITTSPKWI
jgi:hypothetical protein